jgi:hypothetical protein
VTQRPSSGETPPIPPDIGLNTTLRAVGLRIIRDTRPNHFFPTAGMKLEFTSDFFAKDLGSKYSFQPYRLTFNKYASLSRNQVLAYNFFGCFTGGEPPFYGNCIYGRTMNSADIEPDSISIATCSRPNWSIVWCCQRSSGWRDSPV